jgi:hypothetical protein
MAVHRQDGAPQPSAHQQFHRQADEGWGEQHRPTPPAAQVRSQSYAAPRQKSRLLGLFALLFAALVWLEGARTTRDGWVVAANWLLARSGIPMIVPPVGAWPWYAAFGALLVLGVVYSHIEVLQVPIRWRGKSRHDYFNRRMWAISRVWQVWAVWLVLVVSDVGTMYLGAKAPEAGAAPLFQQIAASSILAALYAIIVTFAPERLGIFGWGQLRG